ncbi:hypothetical protein [Spirosoma sp.]|uniref:hypothetical protein n=1 Tax=Spirosoma sp. TaxID=1899569 RepID=UPI00262927A4|nr:hypothetical protein [Spirosoma sp.]MCX6217667.1 hypothetical protein [Spirosoma sp.]
MNKLPLKAYKVGRLLTILLDGRIIYCEKLPLYNGATAPTAAGRFHINQTDFIADYVGLFLLNPGRPSQFVSVQDLSPTNRLPRTDKRIQRQYSLTNPKKPVRDIWKKSVRPSL